MHPYLITQTFNFYYKYLYVTSLCSNNEVKLFFMNFSIPFVSVLFRMQ